MEINITMESKNEIIMKAKHNKKTKSLYDGSCHRLSYFSSITNIIKRM